MAPKVIWLFAFVALYWIYCISVGLRSMRGAKTASDYFIAGRRIPLWVFVLAATATSFSGWTFMGHPGLIYRDGFQYAYASFYTIAIPLAGVLFLKRQWMLGKRFGYVTPGEMFADYFQGDAIRVLTVLVALLFSVPYLGVQFAASGYLFSVLTDGLVARDLGMWVLAAVVLVYVASGGLRAVAYVDTMQCILMAAGIVIIGLVALNAVGGWTAFLDGLGHMAATPSETEAQTSYFAIPGVIQFVPSGPEAIGGPWTAVMILSYMLALMGVQAAPAFSMWAFGTRDPRPFAPQQVWASAAGVGAILFFFTTIQGMAAHLLGASPDPTVAGLAPPLLDRPLGDADPALIIGRPVAEPVTTTGAVIAATPDALVPYYVNLVAEAAPWLVGLLAVCALAAMQSTGAAYMSTAGAMVTRDLYKRYLNPRAGHATQKLFGRAAVVVIVIAALLVGTFSTDALVLLGGVAVAFGVQMMPSLAAVCWWPWLSRQGATWGLAAGLVVVAMTDSFGLAIASAAGIDLPWGRWPWTIHSAGWGLAANLLVCLAVSALTQDTTARRHRQSYHDFLDAHAALPAHKRRWKPLAWAAAGLWLVFAVGPGAVIGNSVFGAPGGGPQGWTFAIPSIWAWQILFWLLGVGLLWLLAYRMEMSSVPQREVEALNDDFGDTVVALKGEEP